MNKIKVLMVGASIFCAANLSSPSYAQDNFTIFSNADPIPPIKTADGNHEFNIRGRLMMDWSAGSDNDAENDFSGTNLRAGWFGVDAKVAENLSFKFEADFAGKNVVVRDALVRYTKNDWSVTVGNVRVPHTIDFMTPLSQTTFMERSALRFAFGFGRGMGVIVATGSDNWGMTMGLFQGDYKLSSASKEGFIASARGSIGGKVGDGKWMLASSARFRDRNDDGPITYRARSITTQSMFMSSFESQTLKDRMFTIESALSQGSFFATAEYAFVSAKNAIDIGTNANFSGGYLEAGYILTGEQRPMNIKTGSWGRPQVSNPVGNGGKGFWMISARYDVLDLNDKNIFGGEQENYIGSVTWYMTRFMRTIFEYGHTKVKNRASPGTRNKANVFGMRFNIDW